ncbi:MAG: NigD-like N-terminal domain-containing protein [Bacteroides sp.]|nr:NigD-like N-terminal domain-containing protein [Bacteroides sp.]
MEMYPPATSDGSTESSLAIGTLKLMEENDYYFALDEGSKLYPEDTTAIHGYRLIDGQRAFILFRLMEMKRTGYDYCAQVLKIENILTKETYPMPAEKADSIGNDPIEITEAWASAEHLNIQYSFYYTPQMNTAHMLSLVANLDGETEDAAGRPCLEFRHNAFGDTAGGTKRQGIVSFALRSVEEMLKGKSTLCLRHYGSGAERKETMITLD